MTKECEDLGVKGGTGAVGGQGNRGEGRLEGVTDGGDEGKALLMEGGRKGRLEEKRKDSRGLIVGSE